MELVFIMFVKHTKGGVGIMKLRVMIVEDEAVTAFLIKNFLENFGCEVACSVGSGELAVEMSKIVMPDVVMMDISLSGEMDGIEAAGMIKMDHPGVYIVYASAFTDVDTIERARTVGPVAYIEKPIDPEFLRLAIDMITGVDENNEKKTITAFEEGRVENNYE